jgi:hypothetical protein
VLRIFLACCIACCALTASAQVYKHVDKDGNITFTDNPPPNSQAVDLQAPNTVAPPAASAYPPSSRAAAKPESTSDNYKLSITSPADETIIARGPGNFSVSASITPALSNGHMLQLFMDGSPLQAAQTGSSWSLTNVFRGEHSIEVAVVDKDGKSKARSAPIKVYVFRPSSNNK